MNELFDAQVNQLKEAHFLVLSWVARAEDKDTCYNITNCFDDLKHHGITRTKQNAVAIVEALQSLCFVALREEGNRKNLYITNFGAKALEKLVLRRIFTSKPSAFLEGP